MVEFEFSTNVVSRVINELEEANEYIRIAIFQLHNQEVFNLLNRKLLEGIRVEVYTLPYDSINEGIRERVTKNFMELDEHGAKLYFCKWNIGDPERTTTAVGRWYSFHGKFIVTDKAAISLSANFIDEDELDAAIIFKGDLNKIREFNQCFDRLLELFILSVSGFDGKIRDLIIGTGYLNSLSLFNLPQVIQTVTHKNHWITDYPSELCPDDFKVEDRMYICPFDIRGRRLLYKIINSAEKYLYCEFR